MNTEDFTFEQLTTLTAHRNADAILSKAMANLFIGAGFRKNFLVLESLRSQNTEACLKALVELGVPEQGLGGDIAANFAEGFAHYWPELEAKISRHMAYVHSAKRAGEVA